MMKGTPCSRGNYAPLKTSSKTHHVTRSTNPAKRVRAWARSRMDARGGLATLRALYLDSARVKVTGSGTINLADEALSLRVRPLARLADTGITAPLIVGGTIEHPKAHIDAANSAQANIMGFAQSAENLAEAPLGAISGALGGPDRLSSGGNDCANQLAIARDRPGGPQPNSPPSMLAVPANAAKKVLNAPKNLPAGSLRQMNGNTAS